MYFRQPRKDCCVVADLKENRPGISVIISGSRTSFSSAWTKRGLGRIHSLEYSLEHGERREAADFQIIETVTMCGHAMISSDLVSQDGEGRQAWPAGRVEDVAGAGQMLHTAATTI